MNFIDLHQDIAGAGSLPILQKQTDFSQLEKVNTKVVFATGFTLPEENLEEVMERDFSFYEEQCSKSSQWKIIKNTSDVDEIFSTENKHGIVFHIEGFPHFSGDLKLLERWHDKGLRSVGLVWNDDNPLGGGTNSTLGLTKLGREFIAWCEEKNILIDLSHANQKMFWDCMEVLKRPSFISHGGLTSLVPSNRNFTDEQLLEVVQRDGVVGIFFPKSSMGTSESFSVKDIANHVKKAIDLLGNDAIAIGSDFGGMISGTPINLRSTSDIGNLWAELVNHGLSEGQISQVAFGNAQRYLKENLPE